MEAYVDEVRKLEECLDGIQAEHVPRAENDIADYLSNCAALKLPVEPGKYFPTELPGAATEDAAVNADPATGQPTSAGPQAMAIETDTSVAEEMPLVLVVEP